MLAQTDVQTDGQTCANLYAQHKLFGALKLQTRPDHSSANNLKR